MNYKEMEKYWKERSDYRIMCRCGHSITMPPRIKKKICQWCGNYVFRDARAEFVYRLDEKLKQEKRNLPKK